MTPSEARAAANVIGTQLQHEWMTTAKVIAAIPDENKDWKPEPKSRSAWELAVHLAGADIWFLDSILNGKFASDSDGDTKLKAAAPTRPSSPTGTSTRFQPSSSRCWRCPITSSPRSSTSTG